MAMYKCGHPLLIKEWINSFNVDLFRNETAVCCSEIYNGSVVALFENIFIGKMEQNETILCLKSSFNIVFVEWKE